MSFTKATILVLLAALLGPVGPARSDLIGPAFSLRTLGGGGPALIDSNRGFSSGWNPISRAESSIGVNLSTGTIYGMDNGDSGTEVARMDPAFEYEKGTSFVNAGIGTTRVYTTTYQFAGSVGGAVDLGSNKLFMGPTWDPFMATNGVSGVMAMAASGSTPTWREYIAQTAAQGLGQLNEGTVASPVDTSARVTSVALQDGISGYGSGHWHGLEMDAFAGQFVAADNDIGPRLVSRYFFGQGQNNFKPILIVHANAARSAEPTATTVGTREAYRRGRTSAGSTLLSQTDFDALVPDINDLGFDLAQDPLTGDLYILSALDATSPEVVHQAYLSAIRPIIPDDTTIAPSWQIVDLDPDSDATHLLLSSFHADLAWAGGIAFSPDGSRLYASVTSTSGGAAQAAYALDVARAAPEPATAGFLALGGASILGAYLLRRRRRA